MLDGGFRPQLFGVAMHLGNEPGYRRQEVLPVDDWRWHDWRRFPVAKSTKCA